MASKRKEFKLYGETLTEEEVFADVAAYCGLTEGVDFVVNGHKMSFDQSGKKFDLTHHPETDRYLLKWGNRTYPANAVPVPYHPRMAATIKMYLESP